MTSTFAFAYTRTHTANFAADNMKNILRDIVLYAGLDPDKLLNNWRTTGEAIKTWLLDGDLVQIIIEFYLPHSNYVEARWDFPIDYDGNGAEEDMWVDKSHLQRTLNKSRRPPSNCEYRVIIQTHPGAVDIEGFTSTNLLSTEKLECRGSGTVIATGDIIAASRYWR